LRPFMLVRVLSRTVSSRTRIPLRRQVEHAYAERKGWLVADDYVYIDGIGRHGTWFGVPNGIRVQLPAHFSREMDGRPIRGVELLVLNSAVRLIREREFLPGRFTAILGKHPGPIVRCRRSR